MGVYPWVVLAAFQMKGQFMRFAFVVALAACAVPASAQQVPATIGLLDAVRMGRDRGIAAVSAQNTALAAAARIGQRRADILPNLAGSASWTRQTLNLDEFGLSLPGFPPVTPDFTVWRLQVSARQALLDPAALARIRAARENATAAELDARTAADLAGATAGLMYLRALGADETVRARLADSAIAASLLQQGRRLVDAGVSPAIDATRGEVQFAAVRTQLEVARNAAGRARLDLLRALDLPAGGPVALSDSLTTPTLPIPTEADSAVAFALAHRSDVAAERARTAYQQRSLGAIRAEYLPSLGVQGAWTASGRETSSLRGTYNLQLGISIPILDGFRRQARSAEQDALLGVQEARERDVARQADNDVRGALLDVASALQQTSIAADRVRLAETELQQAQQRFGQGVAGSVETTQAQGAVIAAHDAWIQARLAYATARLAAYRALGMMDQLH
jgi:outer membrane protein